MTETEVTQLPNYSIRQIYGLLREEWPKIPWRRLVCNNKGVPKWIFILFLALHRRLQTKDRLACWVNLEDMICPLCQEENEDIDHLLFQCNYATRIWGKLLQWLGIAMQVLDWKAEVEWVVANAKGKTAQQEVYRMALAGGVYHIWKERNARVFDTRQRTT
ncbi:hypothetical protein MTR67_048961 [Solanum verrucosum]|uniref:Reverse transcriptase zinc-binding domain-containing protein n=1 Tax=Solanum verrucosum TaxID=315347 RepID=A0AAF0ZXW5_SOLVR|nr:hypothetical protein MTR67_048961 [Solanum verrucosum]